MLIVVGLLIAAIGAVLLLVPSVPWLGRQAGAYNPLGEPTGARGVKVMQARKSFRCAAAVFVLVVYFAAASADDAPRQSHQLQLSQTLQVESYQLHSLVFSPDGKILAAGGWKSANNGRDIAIKLWDVRSGGLIRTLSGHTGLVNSLAFSPNSRILASGSNDKTVNLWDVSSGEIKGRLGEFAGEIAAVDFSTDGRLLAIGGYGARIPGNERNRIGFGELKLWDVELGKLKLDLTDHPMVAYAVAISPDGETLVAGGRSHTSGPAGLLQAWNVSTGKWKFSLDGHRGLVHCVAFAPDGDTLASASDKDALIRMWDLKTAKQKTTLTVPDGARCRAIAYFPSGKMVATGYAVDRSKPRGVKGDIAIWNTASQLEIERVSVSEYSFATFGSLAVSPNGAIVACSVGQEISLWKVAGAP